MITFQDNFEQRTQDYVLFQLPEDIEERIKKEGKIDIINYNEECFFVGTEKVYLLQKVEISNTLLITEPKNGGFESKTIKNSFFLAKEETPNYTTIIEYFSLNSVKKGESCFKEEMRIERILEKFPLSYQDLEKVIKKL